MYMFAEDLGRVFGTRTDVRAVRDPWGLGYTFGVRRADDPRCKGALEEKGDNPVLKAAGRIILKTQLDQVVAPRVSGFRQKPKPTRAEAEVAAEEGESEEAATIRDAMDEVVRDFDVQQLFNAKMPEGDRDLNGLKPVVAQHLIDWWEGAREAASGDPVPCTLPNRLNMLGWDGRLVLESNHDEASGAGVHYFRRDEEIPADLAKLVAAGLAASQDFAGNHRDAQGRAYEVPAGVLYGPALVGDALARFLIVEARKSREYSQEQVKEDAEALKDSPVGEPALSTT